MSQSIADWLFEEYRLFNPNTEVERCEQTGILELTVELKDGQIVRYDSPTNSTRTVNPHYDELIVEDEEYFRLSFSRNLRRLIRDKDLSREKLAERSNVSYYGICNYLNAKTTPTFFVVNKLARALDCEPSELIRP